MRRWWVSVRFGRWLIAWWPFDPRRSMVDGDCLPDIFGVIVGCSDPERYPVDDGWFTQDGRDWTPPEASPAVEPMTGLPLAVRRAKGGPLSTDGAAEIEAFYAGLRADKGEQP